MQKLTFFSCSKHCLLLQYHPYTHIAVASLLYFPILIRSAHHCPPITGDLVLHWSHALTHQSHDFKRSPSSLSDPPFPAFAQLSSFPITQRLLFREREREAERVCERASIPLFPPGDVSLHLHCWSQCWKSWWPDPTESKCKRVCVCASLKWLHCLCLLQHLHLFMHLLSIYGQWMLYTVWKIPHQDKWWSFPAPNTKASHELQWHS